MAFFKKVIKTMVSIEPPANECELIEAIAKKGKFRVEDMPELLEQVQFILEEGIDKGPYFKNAAKQYALKQRKSKKQKRKRVGATAATGVPLTIGHLRDAAKKKKKALSKK